MASDRAQGAPKAWNRGPVSGFEWVSSSPSPAKVAELEGCFPDVVQIPSELLDSSGACWKERAIIARTFHRWIPPEAFIREFRRAGITGEIHPVCLAYRCSIFRFEHSGTKELVLARPWVVNGEPVAMENWRPEFIPAVDSVSSALLWVRLPALPLEFWNDAVLEAILAPAGQFVSSDPATQSMSRGAFARACLRVDLRRSLRPGVRVQGSAYPFWQQFQYENLDGICPCCGSLHLSGPCSMSSESIDAEQASSGHLFGPWMSASRRRKSPASVKKDDVPANGSPPVVQVSPSPEAVKDGSLSKGWSHPAKAARRRSLKAVKLSDGVTEAPGLLSGELGSGASCFGGVPVGSSRAGLNVSGNAEVQTSAASLEVIPEHQILSLKNPFGLLDMGNKDGGLVARLDVNPGPSKRARPEESLQIRSNSKNGQRRGKGNSFKSNDKKKFPSTSYSLIPGKDPSNLVGRTDMTSSSQVTEFGTNLGQSSMGEISRHGSILVGLKSASMDQSVESVLPVTESRSSDSVSVADSQAVDSLQMNGTTQSVVNGFTSMGHSSDQAMVDDQGGSHPPPTFK